MLRLADFDKAAKLVKEGRALDQAIFNATPNEYYPNPCWLTVAVEGVAMIFPVADLLPVLERKRAALLDELRALGVGR